MTPKRQALTLVYAGSLICWGIIAGRVFVPLQKGYALQATLTMPGTTSVSSVSSVSYSSGTSIGIYGVIVLGVVTAILNLVVWRTGEWVAYATVAIALIVYILVTREYGLIGTPISFWFVFLPTVVAVATRYFGRTVSEEL